MLATASALAPFQPLPSSMLSLSGSNNSPMAKRPSASASPPPSSLTSKNSVAESAAHQVTQQQSPPTPKTSEDNLTRKFASPAPVKLPESKLETALPAAASPRESELEPESVVTPPLTQPVSQSRSPTASPNNKNSSNVASQADQAPAQLALLLSSALTDVDALRRELAAEKKRAARAERLLVALQVPASPSPTATNTNAGASSRNPDSRLQERAAKAITDAETRAEQAERARDDAIHALSSLSTCFAEFERYEAACALRASDARGAYSRLLTSFTTAHPVPQATSSPSLSTSSPREEVRLNLPRVPAALPSLPIANHLLGPGTHFSATTTSTHGAGQSARYARPLPAHAAYVPVHSPIEARHPNNAFDSLPLPPPPSASGLATISSVVPSKRAHGQRTRADEIIYDDQKRRRLAMDVDMEMGASMPTDTHSPYGHRAHSRQPSYYQAGAQPLSAHPSTGGQPFAPIQSPPPSATRAAYDRAPSGQYSLGLAPGQSTIYRENIPSPYAPPPSAGSRYSAYDERERDYAARDREGSGPVHGLGLGRVDARELVRDAKARERRERERESYLRHPQQAPAQLQLHASERGGPRRHKGRSRSHSSAGSKSSLSIDEMLLETATATDRDRGRPGNDLSEQSAAGAYAVRQGQIYGAPSSVNGASPSYGVPGPAPPVSSQPMTKTSSMHASSPNPLPSVNGSAAGGRKPSVPASQLMTLGPSGTIISGGGGEATPAVDPAVKYPGLRTCRQCGMPGRYKEGKCVEKWGPGPHGPGTVCDRCRKKMKRVERRGTIDSANISFRGSRQNVNVNVQQKAGATGGGATPLRSTQSQSQSQSQLQSQSYPSQQFNSESKGSQGQMQLQPHSGRASGPGRTDTLIVETDDRSRSPNSNSRYHNHASMSVPAARPHPSLPNNHAQTHYGHGHEQPPQPQSRRAPTPPYITSIPTHEQYGARSRRPRAGHSSRHARDLSVEGEREDHENPKLPGMEDDRIRERGRESGGGGKRAVSGYAHSYARQTHESDRDRDERDELEDDAEGDGEADVDADGSGVPDADGDGDGDVEQDADADADADIMDAVDATMNEI